MSKRGVITINKNVATLNIIVPTATVLLSEPSNNGLE